MSISPTPTLATQSGPLLVRGGIIHPEFREDSSNRRIRSGVGVDATGRVVFVLSQQPTTFFAMATLFRDHLACSDALYLDGDISRFHFPGDPPADADRESTGDFAGIFATSDRDKKARCRDRRHGLRSGPDKSDFFDRKRENG